MQLVEQNSTLTLCINYKQCVRNQTHITSLLKIFRILKLNDAIVRSWDLKEVGTLLQRAGPRCEIDCWHILVQQNFGIILELFLVLLVYCERLVTKILLNTAGF